MPPQSRIGVHRPLTSAFPLDNSDHSQVRRHDRFFLDDGTIFGVASRSKISAGAASGIDLGLAKTGIVSLSAGAVGVTKQSAYLWRAEDPEFEAQWDDAIEAAADVLEAEARRRAVEGIEVRHYDRDGKLVSTSSRRQFAVSDRTACG